MGSIKLLIIRLTITSIIVVSTFITVWYVIQRYKQLNQTYFSAGVEEVNNSRLNKSLVDSIDSEFNSRKIYTNQDSFTITFQETDPFQE